MSGNGEKLELFTWIKVSKNLPELWKPSVNVQKMCNLNQNLSLSWIYQFLVHFKAIKVVSTYYCSSKNYEKLANDA